MKFNWATSTAAAAILTVGSSGIASAAAIVPTYDSFGTLSAATFGGSGIPNTSVAITTINHGGGEIVLGLSAAQRFANPMVTDDGAGTFTAEAGPDTLDGDPTLARWNFNFYGSYDGTAPLTVQLLYDFDPAAGTDAADHGILSNTGAGTTQDSFNLGFAFLDSNPFAPTFPSFDPSARGEYTFALIAYDAAGLEIGRSAIRVNTAPEPATLALMGMGMFGLAAAQRRRLSKR